MSTAQIDVYKEWLGIPEGPRPPDHYELLRAVRFEDDPEKIRKNYRKLNAHVRKYATGQYSERSQELLNELARAMLCLTDPERKREYDESLGREFTSQTGPGGQRPMEDVLVEQKIITSAQRRELKQFAEARGLTTRDAAVQMKLTDQQTATQALAVELGMTYVDLNETIPDDSVLDQVPRDLCKRNRIVPLFVDGDVLLVACIEQPTPDLEEELRLRFGVPVRAALATPLAVNQAIAKYYAPGMRDESKAGPIAASGTKSAAGKAKAGGPRKPMSQLSPDEQRQRRNIGLIIMCWATILASLIFFQLPNFVPAVAFLAWFALVIPPVAIAYVLLSYWK